MASPAQRYADARRRQATASSHLASFAALYPFGLDPFQVRACEALEAGGGVLVAAPTGAGKTVVGEFAVHLALAEGRKCFYTTPIKALSNQKYADLVARYGADRVGLLTGDNSVNGEAPVVVMTTEVLRNMLYAGRGTLGGLGYVVMDEVHYLSDRFRGAVWEEVIIHLPASVALVSLSATVSNAEEFGDWLGTVRGDTEVVVEEHRPVPLWQHVMANGRLWDLFVEDRSAKDGTAKVNPELVRLSREQDRFARSAAQRPSRGGRRPRGVRGPSRVEVLERLDAEGLLPAITFIFSRAGCDAAVRQCLHAGLRLLTPEERAEVRVVRRGPVRRHPARGPARARLPRVARGPGARHRRAPRRHAADLQGGRRAAVRARPGEGGLRHRDAGPGHQHAGPVGGAGAAGEVERREPRRRDAGGVHPADRAGRPARHRRRGSRGGGLGAGARAGRAGRARLDPDLSAAVQLPAVVQHGGQPGRPGRPGPGPRPAAVVVRPVPGRPGGGRAGPAGGPQRGGARGLPRGDDLPPRRLRGVRRAAPGDRRPGGGAVAQRRGEPAGPGSRLAGGAAAR